MIENYHLMIEFILKHYVTKHNTVILECLVLLPHLISSQPFVKGRMQRNNMRRYKCKLDSQSETII